MEQLVTFQADYPGAIVVEASQYGYSKPNVPVGFVYHTPEEEADDDPQTPGYLAGTTREASYTYFVSFLGFVFQLVPESEGAYANAVNGKPYPSWANPNLLPPANNLNLQGISVSFEGHAATIHRTMVRGESQWRSGVALVAHRASARNINPNNWARHADVSVLRGDPGSLDLVTFTLDVKAEMEDDMTPEDKQFIEAQTKHLETRQNAWGKISQDEHLALKAQLEALQTTVDNLQAGGGLNRGDTVRLE